MSPVIPFAHREPPHSRWQSGEGGEDQARGQPRQLLLSARLPDGSDHGRAFFRPAAWQSSALSPLSPPVGDSPAIFFIFFQSLLITREKHSTLFRNGLPLHGIFLQICPFKIRGCSFHFWLCRRGLTNNEVLPQ